MATILNMLGISSKEKNLTPEELVEKYKNINEESSDKSKEITEDAEKRTSEASKELHKLFDAITSKLLPELLIQALKEGCIPSENLPTNTSEDVIKNYEELRKLQNGLNNGKGKEELDKLTKDKSSKVTDEYFENFKKEVNKLPKESSTRIIRFLKQKSKEEGASEQAQAETAITTDEQRNAKIISEMIKTLELADKKGPLDRFLNEKLEENNKYLPEAQYLLGIINKDINNINKDNWSACVSHIGFIRNLHETYPLIYTDEVVSDMLCGKITEKVIAEKCANASKNSPIIKYAVRNEIANYQDVKECSIAPLDAVLTSITNGLEKNPKISNNQLYMFLASVDAMRQSEPSKEYARSLFEGNLFKEFESQKTLLRSGLDYVLEKGVPLVENVIMNGESIKVSPISQYMVGLQELAKSLKGTQGISNASSKKSTNANVIKELNEDGQSDKSFVNTVGKKDITANGIKAADEVAQVVTSKGCCR